jgi:hypothetical protein
MPYLPLSSRESTLDAIGEWFTVFTADPDGWAQETGSWPVRVETLTGVHDIGPHGALLVRPDGHIAARWTELPTDEKVVHRALAAVTT